MRVEEIEAALKLATELRAEVSDLIAQLSRATPDALLEASRSADCIRDEFAPRVCEAIDAARRPAIAR